MKLNRPSAPAFVVALVLAALALLSFATPIPLIGVNRFWVMTAAYLVLALGTVLEGQ